VSSPLYNHSPPAKIEKATAALRKVEAEGVETKRAFDEARRKREPGFLASVRESSQRAIVVRSRVEGTARQLILGSVGEKPSSSHEGTASSDVDVSPDILLHPATCQCTGCASIAALSCKDKEKSCLVSLRFLTKK
jgi:hypothetical protein